MNLIWRKDFRQRLDVLQFGFGECSPLPAASAGEEELDATEGDAERSIGELFFDLEMQEPLTQLFFGDFVGRTLAVVGQLADGPEVSDNNNSRGINALDYSTRIVIVRYSPSRGNSSPRRPSTPKTKPKPTTNPFQITHSLRGVAL